VNLHEKVSDLKYKNTIVNTILFVFSHNVDITDAIIVNIKVCPEEMSAKKGGKELT